MTSTFNLCKKLIETYKTKGQTEKMEELAEKIDIYFAAGRLTDEEYNTLQEMMKDEAGNNA